MAVLYGRLRSARHCIGHSKSLAEHPEPNERVFPLGMADRLEHVGNLGVLVGQVSHCIYVEKVDDPLDSEAACLTHTGSTSPPTTRRHGKTHTGCNHVPHAWQALALGALTLLPRPDVANRQEVHCPKSLPASI